MTQVLTVGLLWDNSREEHGEDAMLVDVFVNKDAAEKAASEMAGDDEDFLACLYAEERRVKS